MEIDKLTAQLKTLFPDNISWDVEEREEKPDRCFNASAARTHELRCAVHHRAGVRLLRLGLSTQVLVHGEDRFTFENTVYTSKYGDTGHGETAWKVRGTGTFLESAYSDMLANVGTLLDDYDDILTGVKKLAKRPPPVSIKSLRVAQDEWSQRLSMVADTMYEASLRPGPVERANQRVLRQFKDSVKSQIAYVKKIQQLSETIYAKNPDTPAR